MDSPTSGTKHPEIITVEKLGTVSTMVRVEGGKVLNEPKTGVVTTVRPESTMLNPPISTGQDVLYPIIVFKIRDIKRGIGEPTTTS